jgi:O-acetylserine/cysteine efflux transporter
MKLLLLTAFLFGVPHFGLIFWGMKLVGGVGSASIAAQLTVPFSTILAIIFLKETVGWLRVVGISISFFGVVLLGFDPEIFAYWHGLLVIISAAFIYSVCAILMRSLKEVPAVTVQAWVALMGVLGSVVISFIFESGQFEAIASASTTSWAGVAYTAIASSLIGHGGANYLFRKYEVSTVSVYFLSAPLFSIAAGVLFMGETLSWKLVMGGMLTVSGVLIVTIRNSQKAKALKSVKSYGV